MRVATLVLCALLTGCSQSAAPLSQVDAKPTTAQPAKPEAKTTASVAPQAQPKTSELVHKIAATRDDTLIAMGLCSSMESKINVLVDYTTTKCLPTADAGGTSFIFISSKPVFDAEAANKAWMLVVVGAYGHEMNAKSEYKTANIYFADVDRAKKLQYQVMSGSTAKTLQRQAKSNRIDLDTMWRQIGSAVRLYNGTPN
jgi:hypothetical protein